MIKIYFILAVLLKQLLWASLVPIWHFPDEQAHFAQLQNLAENRSSAQIGQGSTSLEIAQSEKILKVLRDSKGNNDYTFHPQFNLNYADNSNIGLREEEIINWPSAFRTQSGINEATSYPPLYYYLGAWVYRLVKPFDLFTRVMAVRIYTAVITTLAAYLALLIGQLLFKKDYQAMALAVLVAFQPMFSFVGSGVSSDPLFNLIYMVFIYYLLQAYQAKKLSVPILIKLLAVIFLGFLTKQQMVIALPTAAILTPKILSLLRAWSNKTKLMCLMAILFLGLAAYRLGETWRIIGFLQGPTHVRINPLSHLTWTITHTIKEVLPWYWGVFKWLGVVLPVWVRKVQMRLLILAVLPLLYLFKERQKPHLSSTSRHIIFLYWLAGLYFLGLTVWDYLFRQAYNFSFGIQGRYFFPTIVAHMGLLIFGLRLFPKKIKKLLFVIITGWWLYIHSLALTIVAQAYYQTNSLRLFLHQVSQYKPGFIKGYPFLVLLLASLLVQLIFLLAYFKYVEE